MIGTTTAPGRLASGDQRIFKYAHWSARYVCGSIPGLNARVLNNPSGARVGVSVGVLVSVGLGLGLGVEVEVGANVSVGDTVEVSVRLGLIVQEGVGLDAKGLLHPTNTAAHNRIQEKNLICLLFIDSEERVMIIDLPVCKSKGVIAVLYETLG